MSIDPRSWYRLDTLASNHTGALQACSQQTVCFSNTNTTSRTAQWQLLPIQSTSLSTTGSVPEPQTAIGPLSIRNRELGPEVAVTVEVTPANVTEAQFTSVALNNLTQQWRFVFVGNHTTGEQIWQIENVANTTDYNLQAIGDEVTMGEISLLTITSQRWLLTEVSDTDVAPSPSSSSSSEAATSGTSSLSRGGIAGAVVGSVLGVLIIVGAAIFFARRRRPRPQVTNSGAQDFDKEVSDTTTSSPLPFNHVEAENKNTNTDDKAELATERHEGLYERQELP